MLISMGTLAIRDRIDMNGTCDNVDIEQSEKRIESNNLFFNMAQAYSEKERLKLERTAGLCPIKFSSGYFYSHRIHKPRIDNKELKGS